MARHIPLILAAAILATSQAQAQTRVPETEKPRRETMRTKPVRANPCAQLGAGFVQVEGSNTCVKIGGSLSVGVGGSR